MGCKNEIGKGLERLENRALKIIIGGPTNFSLRSKERENTSFGQKFMHKFFTELYLGLVLLFFPSQGSHAVVRVYPCAENFFHNKTNENIKNSQKCVRV